MNAYHSSLQRKAGGEWDGCRWTYPQLEHAPDFSRGELRLASEVALAELRGCHVPTIAHERALQTLRMIAKQ